MESLLVARRRGSARVASISAALALLVCGLAAVPAAALTASAPAVSPVLTTDYSVGYFAFMQASTKKPQTRFESTLHVKGAGYEDKIAGGDFGTVRRSSFSWQAGPFDNLVLLRGQRYILWADWHAYSFCTRCDEVGVSPPTTVDVPALEIKKRWSEEDKSAAGKVAAIEGGVSATLGLVSLGLDGTVVGLPAGVALGAVAGGIALASNVFWYIASDPIDMHFGTIAVPARLRAPSIKPVRQISPQAAKAINAMLLNTTREVAVGRAMLTSINRAQGAFKAKRPGWEARQMRAAGTYAGQLATLLDRERRIRVQLVAALRRGRFPTIAVTPDQAQSFAQVLARKGVPPRIADTMHALGAAGREQHDATAQLINSYTSATGTLPDILAAKPQLSALASGAAMLRAFAKRVQAHPTAAAR